MRKTVINSYFLGSLFLYHILKETHKDLLDKLIVVIYPLEWNERRNITHKYNFAVSKVFIY